MTYNWSIQRCSCAKTHNILTALTWNTCSPYHCSFHRELLYLLHSNALMSGTTVYSLWRRSNTARFQCSYKAKRTLAHYGWQKINSFTAKSAHHSTQQSSADRFPMPPVCKHRRTWSLTRIHTHTWTNTLSNAFSHKQLYETQQMLSWQHRSVMS